MAQNNHTPVDFWLDCTLAELREWIDVNNEIAHNRIQAAFKKE